MWEKVPKRDVRERLSLTCPGYGGWGIGDWGTGKLSFLG